MITIPANKTRNPTRTTRRGEACGKRLGMPAAASSSVTDSGSNRTPVATAESLSATRKNNGTAKNNPACKKYWKKNDVDPARRVELRNIAGSSRAAAPRARRRASHHVKIHSTAPPERISQITGDSPSHFGASALGWTNPHVPERKMPYTMSPRRSADNI
jgi:hypothetical protein